MGERGDETKKNNHCPPFLPLLTNSPSHDAVKKSMDESNTTPNPWLATLTVDAPDPSVSMSLPTKPATLPVPYVI